MKIDSFRGEHAYLSNFYPSPFRWDGTLDAISDTLVPTVEHAYQAAKTLDVKWQERILAAETPTQAKKLGRQVPMRKDWDTIKLDVMRKLVRMKFLWHPDLAEKLLATREAELIEGNDWGDRFWGKVAGAGENWLGRILMGVRTELNALRQSKTDMM